MASYRIVSADDHIVEPADLWTTRLELRFSDRAPHIVREGNSDWWHCEGMRLIGMAITGAQTGSDSRPPKT